MEWSANRHVFIFSERFGLVANCTDQTQKHRKLPKYISPTVCFRTKDTVRDGEHIVGADSTLHHQAFLRPGRIIAQSFQHTSGRAYKESRSAWEPTTWSRVLQMRLPRRTPPDIGQEKVDVNARETSSSLGGDSRVTATQSTSPDSPSP
jgi:hypothetical protein